MRQSSESFINDLQATVNRQSQRVQAFIDVPTNQLQWQKQPDQWSALQCIAHLNLYGEYYLPAITRVLDATSTEAEELFKSGIIGNYFAKSMLPDGPTMKTFSDKNPINRDIDPSQLQDQLQQLSQLNELLEQSRTVSLNRTRVPISISRWIRLKLGDIFRVLINHNERHLAQADRMLQQAQFHF